MDFLTGLWYDDNARQVVLGLAATAIISLVKYWSEKAANSKWFKYGAVFFLAALGALYAEVWNDGVISTGGLIGNFISIAAFSIGSYETVGKAAKGLFSKYVPKEDDEDELVQTETC